MRRPRLAVMLFYVALLVVAPMVAADEPFPPPSKLVPIDIAAFQRLPLSSVSYISTIRAFAAAGLLPPGVGGLSEGSVTVAPLLPDSAASGGEKISTGAAKGRLTARTLVVDSTQNFTNSAGQDVEPSVVAQVSGFVETYTSTYTKLGTLFRNYYQTAGSAGSGGGQLPMPRSAEGWQGNEADYRLTGDPYMARTISADPRFPRMYCVGIANSGANFTPPTGIALWYSNDGRDWSTYPRPVVSSNAANVFYDKPGLAVSRESGSLGYIYVTYTYFPNQQNQQEIHVRRSIDGGDTFGQDRCIPRDTLGNCRQGNISMSQVVVDKFGYVYVFFADFGANQIFRSYSTDQGNSWSVPDLVASATQFVPGGQTTLNNSLRAPRVLSAAYNEYVHRLAVVWHQREVADGVSPADVWIATKGAGEPWDVRRLGCQAGNIDCVVPTANDQFMPSIDADKGGGLMATFYSRHADPGNLYYRQYDFYMDGRGNPIQSHPLEEISQFDVNPNSPSVDTYRGFIGDYQHVTYNPDIGTYQNVWVSRQTSRPQGGDQTPLNIWLSRIH